jgi:hypothetical protein
MKTVNDIFALHGKVEMKNVDDGFVDDYSIVIGLKENGKTMKRIMHVEFQEVNNGTMTICLLRRGINGTGKPFAGVAVLAPDDTMNQRLARRISLERAVIAFVASHQFELDMPYDDRKDFSQKVADEMKKLRTVLWTGIRYSERNSGLTIPEFTQEQSKVREVNRHLTDSEISPSSELEDIPPEAFGTFILSNNKSENIE